MDHDRHGADDRAGAEAEPGAGDALADPAFAPAPEHAPAPATEGETAQDPAEAPASTPDAAAGYAEADAEAAKGARSAPDVGPVKAARASLAWSTRPEGRAQTALQGLAGAIPQAAGLPEICAPFAAAFVSPASAKQPADGIRGALGAGGGGPLPALGRMIGAVRIAAGPLDNASLLAALVGGFGYWVLACISLWLAQAGDSVSPVWLPNACVVALMLRSRIGNELPLLLACFAASLAANVVQNLPDQIALVFSLANVVEIVIVLALTRLPGRGEPDMNRLSDLGRLVWAGGLVGPLVSALMIIPAMGPGFAALRDGLVTWFLTDSMAMVLIVPAALLLVDRWRGTLPPAPAAPAERIALLAGGMLCAFLVFRQGHSPLLFLIQPITLLHAFRLGSLGTALHVAAVALVAAVMTVAGLGPIAHAAEGVGLTQLHLLQAFVAANFLTGLPVAAILAGRDRMMARLKAGKQEIDLLADNVTDAILRFDLDGICTYASPSVREVLGAPPETFLGRHATARLHPDTHERVAEALDRLVGGTSERERVTYRRFADGPDGTPVFIEADCAVFPNPETGAREGVVIAARDVTERVELELLLTRARRNAENAARAKSEFLANMSHEIRTPMNGVLGFAELMLQGELAEDQRRFAELIVQSGRSMMMLLNDVLDLSKIESGQFAIDRAPVDLAACLAECAALHRPAATRKGLTLDIVLLEGGSAAPHWLLTDGLRLRQILLNLIGNAVKFTERGGIRILAVLAGHDLRVTVADTGIGISPRQLETIFHPFTQGESQTARRYGGTGLGLSISRQLAGLLGGRIEVESEAGEGSRFTLVLPATLVAPRPDPALRDLADEPASGRGGMEADVVPDLPGSSRILLVEDHDINRILVSEMLERCGQEVALAHDGNEAIAMVIDSVMRGRPYDLVLMDVQMPDCDGLDATRAIRAEGIGPGELPVIALTANAFPEDVAAAREAGMQGHLAKPVDFAKLARTLQRWLPTRIVEDAEQPSGAALPARSRSPHLVARWRKRRTETLAAVREALAEGWLAEAATPPDARRGELARLLHRLAGSAALFDETALGEAASVLERALTAIPAPRDLTPLAEALLAAAATTAAASGSGADRA